MRDDGSVATLRGRRVFLRPVLPKRTSRDPLGKARSGPSCRSARPGSRVRARWPVSLSRASWTGGSRRCSGRGPRGRRFRMVRRDVIVSRRRRGFFASRSARAPRDRARSPGRSRRARREARARGDRARATPRRDARVPRKDAARGGRPPPSPHPAPTQSSKVPGADIRFSRVSRSTLQYFYPIVQRDFLRMMMMMMIFSFSRHHLRGGV